MLARVAVWRAAQQIPADDLRPTGEPRQLAGERAVQQHLQYDVTQLVDGERRDGGRWRELARALEPRLLHDQHWAHLAAQLDSAAEAGLDVPALLRKAIAEGALPAEVPAAALRWRLVDHLTSSERTGATAQPVVREPAAPPSPESLDTTTTVVAAADLTAPVSAAQRWAEVVGALDQRVVDDPGWRGLAAALDRASAAGYDVHGHLPRLMTGEPLPEKHTARALHYRLVDECAAATTPMPNTLARSATLGDVGRPVGPPVHPTQRAPATTPRGTQR